MRSPSRGLVLVGVIAVSALLAACGGASSAPETTQLTVVVKEFTFTPAALTAPAGEQIQITVENQGVVEHDFTIDALEVKITAPVTESVSGTIGPLEAGTYEVYCSIPGHKVAGMTATLTISE
ncbi:MAG TPA: cupredoxin domain-containing protein [Candidatus Limnocylindria bacterium]|nr:cupredoxin domain-containing protein [Candidatus Limnocylindria bacterium]